MSKKEGGRKPGVRIAGITALALMCLYSGYSTYRLAEQTEINSVQAAALQTAEADKAVMGTQLALVENTLLVVQRNDEDRIRLLVEEMVKNNDFATAQAYAMSPYRVEATQDILSLRPELTLEILRVIPPEQFTNSVRLGSRSEGNWVPADFVLTSGSGLITRVEGQSIEVITARHVMEEAIKHEILVVSRPQIGEDLFQFDMASQVQYVWSEDKDFAVVRLSLPDGSMPGVFPQVRVNETWLPEVTGEKLTGLSYPVTYSSFDYFPSIFEIEEDEVMSGQSLSMHQFYASNALNSPGGSGGTIFNASGEAVAMYVAGSPIGTALVTMDSYSQLSLALRP